MRRPMHPIAMRRPMHHILMDVQVTDFHYVFSSLHTTSLTYHQKLLQGGF